MLGQYAVGSEIGVGSEYVHIAEEFECEHRVVGALV